MGPLCRVPSRNSSLEQPMLAPSKGASPTMVLGPKAFEIVLDSQG